MGHLQVRAFCLALLLYGSSYGATQAACDYFEGNQDTKFTSISPVFAVCAAATGYGDLQSLWGWPKYPFGTAELVVHQCKYDASIVMVYQSNAAECCLPSPCALGTETNETRTLCESQGGAYSCTNSVLGSDFNTCAIWGPPSSHFCDLGDGPSSMAEYSSSSAPSSSSVVSSSVQASSSVLTSSSSSDPVSSSSYDPIGSGDYDAADPESKHSTDPPDPPQSGGGYSDGSCAGHGFVTCDEWKIQALADCAPSALLDWECSNNMGFDASGSYCPIANTREDQVRWSCDYQDCSVADLSYCRSICGDLATFDFLCDASTNFEPKCECHTYGEFPDGDCAELDAACWVKCAAEGGKSPAKAICYITPGGEYYTDPDGCVCDNSLDKWKQEQRDAASSPGGYSSASSVQVANEVNTLNVQTAEANALTHAKLDQMNDQLQSMNATQKRTQDILAAYQPNIAENTATLVENSVVANKRLSDVAQATNRAADASEALRDDLKTEYDVDESGAEFQAYQSTTGGNEASVALDGVLQSYQNNEVNDVIGELAVDFGEANYCPSWTLDLDGLGFGSHTLDLCADYLTFAGKNILQWAYLFNMFWASLLWFRIVFRG